MTTRGQLQIVSVLSHITPREKVFLLFTLRQSRQIRERLAGVCPGVWGKVLLHTIITPYYYGINFLGIGNVGYFQSTVNNEISAL